VEEKIGKLYEEIQLDFAFVSETTGALVVVPEKSQSGRMPRAVRPRGLEKVLVSAQAALLDASLEEVNAQLLPLLEFCEAALTRALDLSPLRKGELFSPEEYRSLRGVGQAQWLLNEAAAKRERKTEDGQGQRRKRSQKSETKSQKTDC